eukprot:scaffold238545_cov30-Tisochrysis_lutea.AAC.5
MGGTTSSIASLILRMRSISTATSSSSLSSSGSASMVGVRRREELDEGSQAASIAAPSSPGVAPVESKERGEGEGTGEKAREHTWSAVTKGQRLAASSSAAKERCMGGGPWRRTASEL